MISAGIIAIALMSLPTTAFAYCGNSADGNFSVNCQNGVKVFRHNAPSSIPVGRSAASTQLEIAKIRQETELRRIQADRRSQAEIADLRRLEIENERFRNRIIQHRSFGRTRFVNQGFGFSNFNGFSNFDGFRAGRPVNVRKVD